MKNLALKSPIKEIHLLDIQLPLVHPFRTSFGEENHKQAIIIKIVDEDDNIGWGETSVTTLPGYCYETIETAWHIQKDFLVNIIANEQNQDPEFKIPHLMESFNPIRGHNFAKSGLEASLWALIAEQQNVSLGKIYDSTKTEIPTGVSIGIQKDLDYLISRIESFLDKGYHRIKIKIEPGWDVDVVSKIRQDFGDILLMVDANSAYSLKEKHVETLKRLDQFGLMMIEQPLHYLDMLQHKKLQAQIQTPVCLDESIHSTEDAKMALEFDCCRIINIKPGRVAGYYNALEIGIVGGPDVVWCGGMLETGIGRVHNLFLQANDNFTIPGDTSGSDRYYNPDIISPEVEVNDKGYVKIPDRKGLGVEINEELITKYTRRSLKFDL